MFSRVCSPHLLQVHLCPLLSTSSISSLRSFPCQTSLLFGNFFLILKIAGAAFPLFSRTLNSVSVFLGQRLLLRESADLKTASECGVSNVVSYRRLKCWGRGGGPRLSWLLGLLQVSQISRLLTRRLQCARDTMRLNHFIPNFSELRRQIPARFFQFLPTALSLLKF